MCVSSTRHSEYTQPRGDAQQRLVPADAERALAEQQPDGQVDDEPIDASHQAEPSRPGGLSMYT